MSRRGYRNAAYTKARRRLAERAGLASEPTGVDASYRNIEHVSAPWCWCQPIASWEDPATGDRVYVHRAAVVQ